MFDFPIEKNKIDVNCDPCKSMIVKFGDDWPGVFFESNYAKELAYSLDSAYTKDDIPLLKEITTGIYDLLVKSNVYTISDKVSAFESINSRIDTGHVVFSNGTSGYFIRGDHAFMLRMGIEDFVTHSEVVSSISHIPFLINECLHWSK